MDSLTKKLGNALEKCEDFLSRFDPRDPTIIKQATVYFKIANKAVEEYRKAVKDGQSNS